MECKHWVCQIEKKDAEIERLRAALLAIASGVSVVGPTTTRGLSVLDMAGIASKALDNK